MGRNNAEDPFIPEANALSFKVSRNLLMTESVQMGTTTTCMVFPYKTVAKI